MAAVVASLASSLVTGAGNKTLTATPTVRDLIVCICVQTGSTVNGTLTDNSPDGHGTYFAAIQSVIFNGSADLINVFVRQDLIQRAASTTWTFVPGGVITAGGIHVVRVTGMSLVGAQAVRQSNSQTNQPAAATPAPAFTIPPLTANAVIGAVSNRTNPATLTPPATFTELIDIGSTSPSGLETVSVNSGFTTSTVTWGSTSASVFGAAILELDTRVGGPPVGYKGAQGDVSPLLQAVKRGSLFMLGDKWARRGPIWVPRPPVAVSVA